MILQGKAFFNVKEVPPLYPSQENFFWEGIYVREDFRRRGVARELLAACEQWARKQGCREFASDCELTNRESERFHRALGFGEAGRISCFVKKLLREEEEV